MARRLITTFLSVSLAVALATAALAANDGGSEPGWDVPESKLADHVVAAVDAAQSRIEAVLAAGNRRLERIARANSEPRTATLRAVAVQMPAEPDPTTPPDPTDPPESTEPTDQGGEGDQTSTSTTTTVPGAGTSTTSTTATTSTTTTTPAPPAPPTVCEAPDEDAILVVVEDLLAAKQDAWAMAALDELKRDAEADEAALEAALGDARSVEDIERAYDDAAARIEAFFTVFKAAVEELQAAISRAYGSAHDRLVAACALEDTLIELANDEASELAVLDAVIQQTRSNLDRCLTEHDAEEIEAIEAFQSERGSGSEDGSGSGNGSGDGSGSEDGSGSGNGSGSEDGANGRRSNGAGGDEDDGDGDGGSGTSQLPFAGTAALPLLIAGLALVGAGAITVVVTRRRRDGEPNP